MKNSPMEWDKERLTDLTLKFISGDITAEEQAELDRWLNASPTNRGRFEQRIEEESIIKGIAIREAARGSKEAMKARINWGPVFPLPARRWPKRLVAAAILIPFLAGGVFLLVREGKPKNEPIASVPVNLPPGGNKATLTLANGSRIVLDQAKNGTIARQGQTAIVKMAGGELIYQKEGAKAEAGYNTIATPRGGQYQVLLPDGTEVWLNAASSLHYPTAFSGPRRVVEMTGEAYFEVKHMLKQPFIVKVGDREVEDVGTHFNVNAYEDEPIHKITLLEGAIKVEGKELLPGMQAEVDRNGAMQLTGNADLEEAIAWKNGLFAFNSADIATVMRAIGRWYDVKVNYEARKDSHRFTGQISRNSNASETLQILATSGYHFDVHGKVITVLP